MGTNEFIWYYDITNHKTIHNLSHDVLEAYIILIIIVNK